jgi:hypothetical protein
MILIVLRLHFIQISSSQLYYFSFTYKLRVPNDDFRFCVIKKIKVLLTCRRKIIHPFIAQFGVRCKELILQNTDKFYGQCSSQDKESKNENFIAQYHLTICGPP